MSKTKGLLERLDAGEVVVGDGGFLFCMEKRGYVKAGPWTPEATVEHPEAVRQLHREFLRAGADVMQTFTFYASEDKLQNRGNDAIKIGCEAINQAGCDLAREVADEGGALVAGNICQTPSYLDGKGKAACQAEHKKQIDVFVKNNVDFLIGEIFLHVEEAEWAIEVMKATGKPVVCCLTMLSPTKENNVDFIKECTLRVARAGADVIGVNCVYDPYFCLQTVRIMKQALDEAGIKKHLICQPIGFKTPEVLYENNDLGFCNLSEFPFALEPRVLTRWDCHRYAREAYDLGVRYIGGCCGFEPYHIRAISEELSKERGKLPPASDKHGLWGSALKQHTLPWVRLKSSRSFWENLEPATGRPYAPALSKTSGTLAFSTTPGHKDMKQTVEMTSEEEIKELKERIALGSD